MSEQIENSETNNLENSKENPIEIKELVALPKMHTTYANVIKSLIPSRDKPVAEHELPKAVVRVKNLTIDEENLNDYRKVCGFVNDGRVPATYFAVLSQTVQMNMMATDDFPFAMLGLIHIHNEVRQHRAVFDTEQVAMTVSLENLQPHDKGQQFDFVTKVYADDKLVWEGVSTYLSRQKQPKTDKKPIEKPEKPKTETATLTNPTLIEVPEDIGRRYAFVSGDFNLIHLHPLSARAFGFPKAIAHGMWSKAKALAQFEKLPPAFSCKVEFRQPIFLPSKVAFDYELWSASEQDTLAEQYQFGLYSPDGGRVHLLGEIRQIV